MSGKTVMNRGVVVAAFGATIESCAEKIDTGFRVFTAPFLKPGEEPPNITLVVRLLGRAISSRYQTLVHHNRADFDERANDAVPRSQRDQWSTETHGKLVKYRRLAETIFGPAFAKILVPITGPTANVPSQVHHQGGHTLERFRDPDLKKPPSLIPGFEPNLSEWADDLEPSVTGLGVSLGVIEVEKTKASETIEKKEDGMKDLNFVYSHGYGIVRGLLFLAGLERAGKELPALYRTRRSRRGPDSRESRPAGVASVEPLEPSPSEPSPPEPSPSESTAPDSTAFDTDVEGSGSVAQG